MAQYARQRTTLDPGDALVLVTDGLPEARDARGELLGDERVLACIASAGGGDPDRILDALRSLLSRHLGPTPPEDDITMVVLQASPAP